MTWSNIGILFVSGLVLVLSIRLYKLATGERAMKLNMVTYSFFILFVTAFLPSVVIATNLPVPGYRPEAATLLGLTPEIATTVWAAVMWSLLAIPVGASLAAVAMLGMRRIPRASARFDIRRLGPGWGYREGSLFAAVGLVTVALSLFFWWTMPADTPFAFLVSGGAITESQALRRTFQFGFENGLLRSMINEKTLMTLGLIAYAMAVKTGRSRWWAVAVINALMLTWLSLARGTVGSLVQYWLAFAFMRALLGGRFIKLYEAAFGIVVLVILAVFYKGVAGSFTEVVVDGVIARAVFGQILGTYYALQVIPAHHDFLGFSSSGRLINELLFGSASPDYGMVLMDLYNPAGVTAGTAGHLSSIFLAEAWVNFGVWGLVLSPLWIGFVIQIVGLVFLRARTSAITAALYVTIAVSFGYLSDLQSFYYPMGLTLFMLGIAGILAGGSAFTFFLRRIAGVSPYRPRPQGRAL